MELNQQLNNAKTNDFSPVRESTINDLISIEECKQYLGKFGLDELKISDIRNILTGIANKTIDSYLDNFR